MSSIILQKVHGKFDQAKLCAKAFPADDDITETMALGQDKTGQLRELLSAIFMLFNHEESQ